MNTDQRDPREPSGVRLFIGGSLCLVGSLMLSTAQLPGALIGIVLIMVSPLLLAL